jgi:hypothetical protein
MNKFERRQQFEEFCRLRAIYRLRSDYDSVPTMTVAEAIAFAERLMDPSRRTPAEATAVSTPAPVRD